MKVDQHRTLSGPGPKGTPRVTPSAGRRSRAAGAAAAVGDRVSLSEEARRLARLRAGVGDLDEVRQDRVGELRQRVAEGTYRADFRDVARKFLRELLGELLG